MPKRYTKVVKRLGWRRPSARLESCWRVATEKVEIPVRSAWANKERTSRGEQWTSASIKKTQFDRGSVFFNPTYRPHVFPAQSQGTGLASINRTRRSCDP